MPGKPTLKNPSNLHLWGKGGNEVLLTRNRKHFSLHLTQINQLIISVQKTTDFVKYRNTGRKPQTLNFAVWLILDINKI